MTASAIPDFVPRELEQLELDVPRELLDQLAAYLDQLLDANTRMNLTAIRERDDAWRRHIIDSLTVLPGLEMLDDDARVIDVGSGGGLPGIPVAISLPNVSVTLLEATGKKASFLEQAARELGLANVSVINDRAELVGQQPQHREQYDVAICRAVGPMRELLEYTMPLVKVEGKMLAMKGPRAESELAEAGEALATLGAGDLQVFDAYPEAFGLDTVIVSILKERPTPKKYPRSPGTPRQSPL